MSPTAIVSLACLLSTGEVDPASITNGLAQQDAEKVQKVLESQVCLPENFKRLIGQPKGGDQILMRSSAPTSDY